MIGIARIAVYIVKVKMKILFFLILFPVLSMASAFPRVDDDLRHYDQTITKMESDFSKIPADPKKIEWVKLKLKHMFDTDQYMRRFGMRIPYEHNYTSDEKNYFNSQFKDRFAGLDAKNTGDIKELLKIYDWFRISIFGKIGDNQGWLIVQHADNDPDFQKEVLKILGPLYKVNETKPSNYAYLFDRVAASWSDPKKRMLQRYGTQGGCTGPGTWEPIPIEDPSNIDKRRVEVGLEPMSDYKKKFKDICR